MSFKNKLVEKGRKYFSSCSRESRTPKSIFSLNLNNTLLQFVVLAILYSIPTIFITYPLILNMSTHVFATPEGPVDGIGVIWDFWWAKFSYLNDIPLFPFTYIHAPFGVDLSQGLNNRFWWFYGKWMSLLINEIFAYNLSILLSFVLSGIGMYYLAYFLFRHKTISFLCGFSYAFCPFHIAHALERSGLASIQWIPFALLFLFKMPDRISSSFKNSILYSFFITLNFYFEPHYGFFCLVFSVFYFFYLFVQNIKYPKQIYSLFKIAALNLILIFIFMSPIYLKTLKNFLAAEKVGKKIETLAFERPLKDAQQQSAKFLNYILPSMYHPILNSLTKPFLDTPFYGREALVSEHTLSLGFTFILFLFVLFRKRKNIEYQLTQDRLFKNHSDSSPNGDSQFQNNLTLSFYFKFLWIALFCSILFSLAPYLNLGIAKIPFPSLLLHTLMPPLRAFSRMGIFVMICTILLTGFGMRYVWYPKKSIFLLLFFILCFEFLPIPPLKSKLLDIPLPPEYEWIRNQKGDFIIAEYPLNRFHFLYQMKHQKRMFNTPMVNSEILDLQKKLKDLADKNTVPQLAHLGIRYIVIDIESYKKDIGFKDLLGTLPDFNKISGLKKAAQFEKKLIYLITEKSRTALGVNHKRSFLKPLTYFLDPHTFRKDK